MSKIIIFLKLLEKKSIFIFSAILFKVILEYTCINLASPIFGYKDFYLEVSIIKYLESWLIYLCFLLFTPHLLKQTSDYIINVLFFNFLSPLLVFYSLSNAVRQHLYIVLLGIIIIYLLRKEKKIRLSTIKLSTIKHGPIYVFFICILGIFIVCSWLIFSGGLNFFNLDLTRVYEFRHDASSVINIWVMAYMNIWAYKLFGPVLLIIFLFKKKYFFASLVFLLHVFWFGISSQKAVLFIPFSILFIYIWFRSNRGLSIIPISLTLGLLFTYFFFVVFDNLWPAAIFIIRVFFNPSMLTFVYYEFFSSNEFIYWSDSITSRFIDYPYNLDPPRLIGNFLGLEASANNSFLSTGYMHAGIFGVVFYSFIFALLLIFVDSLKYEDKKIWISVAFIFTPMFSVITSSDLFVALLTDGILLSFLLLYLFRKSKKLA
jgi:hypothetical protein